MLYLLTPAMYPRFLITLDEKLENYPVTVRVGQASLLSLSAKNVDTLSLNRPLMLLVRLESQERYPDSRRINRRCDWGPPSGQSLQRRSTFHLVMC